MADGKRRYKSDRKDYKISVKMSEKDMDILDAAVSKSGKTVSEYVRELIRLGGNVDFRYPEDRARVIRIFSGIANNINQAVRLGNTQGELYFSDIDKLQRSLDEIKSLFGEVLEIWRLQRSCILRNQKAEIRHRIWKMLCSISKIQTKRKNVFWWAVSTACLILRLSKW